MSVHDDPNLEPNAVAEGAGDAGDASGSDPFVPEQVVEPGSLPDQLDMASMLRLAADGELTPEQEAVVERHLASHPGDAGMVATESLLRQACERVLGAVTTPPGLRDRVVRAIEQDDVAEAIDARAAETSRRAFWSRQPTPPAVSAEPGAPGRPSSRGLMRSAGLGLAAALVLGVGVAFVVLSGRAFPVLPEYGMSDEAIGYRDRLVSWVSAEHDRCLAVEVAGRKLTMRDPAEAAAGIGGLISPSFQMPSCERLELTFLGASPCHVPGDGASGHLVFRPADVDAVSEGLDPARISLFVRRWSDELPMEHGRVYQLAHPEDPSSRVVYVWHREGVMYLLVTDAGNAKVCERVVADIAS